MDGLAAKLPCACCVSQLYRFARKYPDYNLDCEFDPIKNCKLCVYKGKNCKPVRARAIRRALKVVDKSNKFKLLPREERIRGSALDKSFKRASERYHRVKKSAKPADGQAKGCRNDKGLPAPVVATQTQEFKCESGLRVHKQDDDKDVKIKDDPDPAHECSATSITPTTTSEANTANTMPSSAAASAVPNAKPSTPLTIKAEDFRACLAELEIGADRILKELSLLHHCLTSIENSPESNAMTVGTLIAETKLVREAVNQKFRLMLNPLTLA